MLNNYQTIQFCEPLHVLYGSIGVLLVLLIFKIYIREYKAIRESWNIFNKLCDVYRVDASDRKTLAYIFKKLSLHRPHMFVSSLHFFDDYFLRIMVAIDKSKRLYVFKSDLLRLYSQIRNKLVVIYPAQSEKRAMPRFKIIDPLFFTQKEKSEPKRGLLFNISGGGIHFFTKHPIETGMNIKVSFDSYFFSTITARVLDVVKKADVFIIRARYLLV
ncbi:MAG: hypothetical protein ABIH47_10735 [Candidatus Omnitrophota bacterium]